MGFSRFPREKKIKWIEVQTPHACIHLEKFMYPLALVSGAPHKAYIFRFNTPTINTFPASGTHTCLILRGYPPLVPIHFWQKVRGLTPPLCSYIIRNVWSTPPAPEPVGVGDLSSLFFSLLSSGAHEWAMSGLWAFLISSGSRPDLVQMSSKTSTHTFETCSFRTNEIQRNTNDINFEILTFHNQRTFVAFTMGKAPSISWPTNILNQWNAI